MCQISSDVYKKVNGKGQDKDVDVKDQDKDKDLQVKGRNIYIQQLTCTKKPVLQRFTMRSGVLISISSRQRSAISGHPLPQQTDFGPAVCSYSRQTHLCLSQRHFGIKWLGPRPGLDCQGQPKGQECQWGP